MTLSPDFVTSWTCPSTSELVALMLARPAPVQPNRSISLVNELRPVDLFCYFSARFGAANGTLNVMRNDNSDNLTHWDWTLSCQYGQIAFWGGNFRTDMWLLGNFPLQESFKEEIISQIRADFANYGKAMSAVRKRLEHWTEFVNPYWRLKRATDQLLTDIASLVLDPTLGAKIHSPLSLANNENDWNALTARYNKAFGLCYGVRSMLPVLAEALVNLLIFIFVRPDIRKDQRLYDNIIRQPIDVRIKSLHINCVGFENAVDYAHDACRHYHSLVNERNYLLHGNVSPEKSSFNEVYFSGTVPVFKEYRSFWQRTIAVDGEAVGLSRLYEEIATVEAFTEYLLSCLTQKNQEAVRAVLAKRDLARNHEDGRLGILFSSLLVDSMPAKRDSDPPDLGPE